jgi:hypothetical protein
LASKQLPSDRQAPFRSKISELLNKTSSKFPEWLTTRPPGPGIFPPSKKEGAMKVKSPWSLVNVYVTAAHDGAANRRLAQAAMKPQPRLLSIGFLQDACERS